VFRTPSRTHLAAAFVVVAVLIVAFGASSAFAGSSRTDFRFSADQISGAPTGAVALAGSGVFDSTGTFAQGGGTFQCTQIIGQGPLTGCQAGQGVRWHTATALASTAFRCSTDALKTATADPGTAVFRGAFFRTGDGNTPSFTANTIVADHDIAPDVTGLQNVWIQGVGCASASVHTGG